MRNYIIHVDRYAIIDNMYIMLTLFVKSNYFLGWFAIDEKYLLTRSYRIRF